MPKKKGGKKGAKIIDGLATNEMSREQLQGHVKRMQIELEREREERNFFMLEREKLFSLWNMTLEQIAVEKDRARLMEVQVADGEREKEEEMSLYKQKLRYLMMEQTKKLSSVRLHHLEKMKRVQEETRSIQKSMQEVLTGKQREVQKARSSIHEIIRRMKMEHVEEITRIRNDFGRDIRRLESDFNRRLFVRQTNARCDDILTNLNIHKMEETEDILLLHETQLGDMKKFYNDLMTNNFAIIATLQNDVEDMKSNEDRLQMEIKNLNDELSKWKKTGRCSDGTAAPMGSGGSSLKKTEKRPEEPSVEGSTFQYRKRAMSNMAKALERKERFSAMLESINEVLLQRTLSLEKERDELKATFSKAIIHMQKKASMTKLISELKLNALAKKETRNPLNTEKSNGSRRYSDEYVQDNRRQEHVQDGTRTTQRNIRPLVFQETYNRFNNFDAPPVNVSRTASQSQALALLPPSEVISTGVPTSGQTVHSPNVPMGYAASASSSASSTRDDP
ncbi:unnamed protein product [Allacma fusca]|uniref:Dynein regulatory complex subunit 4 n=1 Tax=Allacma fusca TaxID=39272 RepID=A0A8J2P1G2_9HEXA|nr:unnamed protein product [Allacma fusca]